MIKLGEKQKLIVVKKVEFGLYLAVSVEEKENRILLPAKQAPEGCNIGDEVEVFIYRDSSDRMIATTKQPKLVMGQVAELTVVQITKIGAFLDWGLEKDLFLPFKQQKRRVNQGEKVLVSLYIDKSNRLCATTNVYENLESNSPYRKNDLVKGRVYEISDNFGAFVAVDNRYSALIPKKELYGEVSLGEDVEARVIAVLPDGRLTLSVRERGLAQIEKDAKGILNLLDSYSGVLPFTEKADPEVIRRETGMSKNEFKRAVGHLLKSGEVVIKDKVIRKA